MARSDNLCFEGENLEELITLISSSRRAAPRRAVPRDRRIVRAPLAPRMVHMNEVREWEGEDGTIIKDETRPGADVTRSLANVFAHLAAASKGTQHLRSKCSPLRRLICICPF